jgi:hypothetical protein
MASKEQKMGRARNRREFSIPRFRGDGIVLISGEISPSMEVEMEADER